jgi:tetratricopeptide (TPR) repeat protein
MLQTGLAQTAGLDVISSGRIHEILVQLGEEQIEDLDQATLGEIARRSGAGAVVVGAVYAAGSDYRIDVQVEDVNNGRVIAAHTATGPDVFALVDDLAERVRGGLELQPAAEKGGIAEITTDSLEAWRYFDEGVKAEQNLRQTDARDAFYRAIELDPNFALAHAHLVNIRNWLVEPGRAAEHERIVLENLERLPERDRLFFLAGDTRRRGDPVRAAELFEELIEKYPDFEDAYIDISLIYAGLLRDPSRALDLLGRGVQANPSSGHLHNQYGYLLFEAGEYAAALQQIEAYAELNPGEPNPLDSLAEMYLRTGQPERAIEYYTEAGRIDPTWTGTPVGRTTAFAMLGRYEEALAEFELYGEAAAALGYPNSGFAEGKAMLLSMVGRNEEAGRLWRRELAANRDSTVPLAETASLLSGAGISLHSGDYPSAIDLGEEAVDRSPDVGGNLFHRQMAILAHAFAGIAAVHLGDLATATEHLGQMEAICDREIQEERWYIDSLKGEIELAEGRPAEAEASFRAAEPEFKMGYGATVLLRAWSWNNSSWRDGAARALRAQGDLAGAIAEYRRLVTPSMTSKFTSFLEPRYVLDLARLLDETGDAEAAAVEYARFAELWKNADPDLQPLVEDARERAATLGG